jgi:hypothetical protein
MREGEQADALASDKGDDGLARSTVRLRKQRTISNAGMLQEQLQAMMHREDLLWLELCQQTEPAFSIALQTGHAVDSVAIN